MIEVENLHRQRAAARHNEIGDAYAGVPVRQANPMIPRSSGMASKITHPEESKWRADYAQRVPGKKPSRDKAAEET